MLIHGVYLAGGIAGFVGNPGGLSSLPCLIDEGADGLK
jgi:hypothetical protein